ncbi:suppressor for copper-sensitivity B [Litoreibacter ponti]|uniref:Suppressor for copper-sensitivity B n=1 Tax=Litoreibacter ponti TaxID=1510457 RepID=A0A2T6BHK5_9RHOB|nr:protein-disulfide reductase DsbD domain-containing protein [Litoreibacter ponti]PTX55540.1 suppressor for copper-sensitivity B [Litoreibacter ponti]
MRILGLVLLWLSVLAVPLAAASSLAFQSDRLTARLITAENSVTPDAGTISAALELELAPGWKTYWKSPGAVGYAPELDWSGAANVARADILYPAPTRFEAFEIENYGYADAVTFPLQIMLDEAGETVVLSVEANVLVCEELCVPEMFTLSVTLPAGTSGIDAAAAERIADAAARVPGAPEDAGITAAYFMDDTSLQVEAVSATPFTDPHVFPDLGPNATFGPPEVSLSSDRREALIRLPVQSLPDAPPAMELTLTDGARAAVITPAEMAAGPFQNVAGPGLWSVVLIALLGGLILNIMPCVLPVLAVKFTSALKAADQSPARIRAGFVVSALGVLCFMWALAAVLLAVRAGGGSIGWGTQFQNPVFLGVMIAIMVAFAANMAGLFEITLPQRLNTKMAQMESGPGLLGDFSTGALAAVLATPCSAPFLGTAVTFALAGSALDTLVIFTALGLGLALPYLLVALRPSLVQALPTPGPWMVRVRWVMAACLLATALWLGFVLLGVSGALVAGILATLLVTGVVVLTIPKAKRVAFALFAAAIFVPAILAPAPAPVAPERAWAVFSEQAIAERVAAGDIVFVDITASWCLTCKANKARVLNRGAVADTLASDGVTALRGDWTRPDEAILTYLQDNGRFGIPFNKVYGPSAPQGIALPEFLTQDAVMEAVAQAR